MVAKTSRVGAVDKQVALYIGLVTSEAVRAESSAKFSSAAWHGDVDDLRTLLNVIEELHASAAESVTQRFRKLKPQRFEAGKLNYTHASARTGLPDDWWIEDWERRDAEELKRALESIEIQIRAEHRSFSRVLEGPPSLVLDKIDLRDLRDLKITMGRPYSSETPSLTVSFSGKNGVETEIRDQSADWIVVAEKKLRTVITRQRPWYWWTRSYWIVFTVLAIPALTISWMVLPIKSLDTAGAVVLGVTLAAICIGIFSLWTKMVPGFELIKNGSRGRGTKIFAMLGTLALFVLGIVVPLLIPSGR